MPDALAGLAASAALAVSDIPFYNYISDFTFVFFFYLSYSADWKCWHFWWNRKKARYALRARNLT